ncbi:MAG: MarP family serine protease [Acidimicrobiaceae bacterium]|nr:MarP family serine protease [Acidimicrobiaceae bacterium]
MNWLDLVIVLVAAAAALGGYRLGFLARAVSWIGLGLGLYLGARFLPDILNAFDLGPSGQRLLTAAAVLIGAALIGQAVGLVVGGRLLAALPLGPLRTVDRAVGAGVGVLGVFVALWLLLPAISSVSGLPAQATQGSAISRWVSRLNGPPGTLQALRRVVGEQTFPAVFNALRNNETAGPAPSVNSLSDAVTTRVAASTVKVQGQACDRIQDGSGFAIAADMVVTNAHVVAGEPPGQTDVITPSGSQLPATVIRFDPDRDLALLSVPGLNDTPLTIGTASVGAQGAVFGHPGGQASLAVTPARVSSEVDAQGRDLYGMHTTSRDVFIMASDLAPGDSGGALVVPSGQVAGVAFAIDPNQSGTSYALSYKVLNAFLAPAVTPTAVSTQGCVTD